MQINLQRQITAVITCNKDIVGGGGVPIFYVEDEEEALGIARALASILQGGIHELRKGLLIIVKH